MSETTKTSAVLLCIVTVITVTKFILYYFSHSNAVLSEAWHSFSDVATTALVVFAIYHQRGKDRHSPTEHDAHGQPNTDRSKAFTSAYAWFRSINSELKISLLIGLALVLVSASILWHAAFTGTPNIAKPLTTGCIFVGLSVISFFVYRLEASLASIQESAALKADSQHNRADMIISLLTGISLILYHLGHNFDRLLCVCIALYILTFAVEMVVNSLASIIKRENGIATNYRFATIAWSVFDPLIYARLFQKVDDRARFSPRSKKIIEAAVTIVKIIYRWGLRLACIGMLVIYCSTFFFIVQADQQALQLRFGRIVNSGNPLEPGLYFKYPWPIDAVYRFNTRKINELSVGNAASADTPLIWNQEHGDNRMFISGDNNLFLPYIKIYYRLRDPLSYYASFKKGGAEKFLEYTAYQSLIHLFAGNALYDIALFKRKEWISLAHTAIQSDLDHYGTGLEIVDVCINDLHPPLEVAESYEEVVAAYQVREKYKNHAQGYAHYKRIRERSDGLQTVYRAQSDVFQKIQTAKGEALNYLLRLDGYNQNPFIAKRLMTLETTTNALANKQKILVDPKSGIPQKLLYLEKYMNKRVAPVQEKAMSKRQAQ